jgi:FAD/FMN-containing dehydrogenase
MLGRREFLKAAGGATALSVMPVVRVPALDRPTGVLVNDVHSKLNATNVSEILRPTSPMQLRELIGNAKGSRPFAIAGGRHAMGGQQFITDGSLIDTTALRRVIHLDAQAGVVEVEAGIQWPELVQWLVDGQVGRTRQWGIRQKQTGADRLSIGGALSANVHGRGLSFPPFVADVESFRLIDAGGRERHCSRDENAELFALAIGGYGLFGAIATVRLRLMPRTKLERVVRVASLGEMAKAMDARAAEGFLFGDGQFAVDPDSDRFLDSCVFSCYRKLPDDAAMPETSRELSDEDWRGLLLLAHEKPGQAFERYADYYLTTDGQRYWSDTHQLAAYIDDYHAAIDRHRHATAPASEMISEVYVPRAALPDLMARLREDFRTHGVKVIYGTVRAIEPDTESFLPWASERWLCTVMNFHIEHSEAGIAKARVDFRRLFDHALALGGSFFLTYHRWATREQVLRAYPRFPQFLAAKRRLDPNGRFRSDWYDHYASLFA